MAGLQVMNAVVDKFDQTIKAMKGSQEFTDKKKVERVQKMLVKYFDLFLAWITLLSKEDIIKLAPDDSGEWNQGATEEQKTNSFILG